MMAIAALGFFLLASCGATTTSAPVVVFDGAPFATLTEAGWVHTSGELALAADGDRVVVGKRSVHPSELVSCAGEHCVVEIPPSPVELDGSQLVVDGEVRGEVRDATTEQERSALVMVATYRPPGPIAAQIIQSVRGDTRTLEVSALPDGRLVEGPGCAWPTACTSVAIGSYTSSEITLGDTRLVMDELVEGTQVRAEPGEDWVLRVTPEGDLRAGRRWAAQASTGGRLRVTRPEDADWSSPQATAAMVALARRLALNEEAGLVPPPPTPR